MRDKDVNEAQNRFITGAATLNKVNKTGQVTSAFSSHDLV